MTHTLAGFAQSVADMLHISRDKVYYLLRYPPATKHQDRQISAASPTGAPHQLIASLEDSAA